MWLCLCAPSMVWAQEYTEANDKHVTTQAVVKVAPPALSPPVLNVNGNLNLTPLGMNSAI